MELSLKASQHQINMLKVPYEYVEELDPYFRGRMPDPTPLHHAQGTRGISKAFEEYDMRTEDCGRPNKG